MLFVEQARSGISEYNSTTGHRTRYQFREDALAEIPGGWLEEGKRSCR